MTREKEASPLLSHPPFHDFAGDKGDEHAALTTLIEHMEKTSPIALPIHRSSRGKLRTVNDSVSGKP